MHANHGPPFVARPGDVLVELPHTLTRGTRGALEARARAALPSSVALSHASSDPRLVLDARGCAVIDDAGLASLADLRRAAAAAGVDIVVVDPAPALAAWLANGRQPLMPLAFRPEDAPDPAPPTVPNDPPPPGVLLLDDAARARLAARRRR
jgi:anti-anti-sigma regulatory factor